jgi:hypothetical protein
LRHRSWWFGQPIQIVAAQIRGVNVSTKSKRETKQTPLSDGDALRTLQLVLTGIDPERDWEVIQTFSNYFDA